MDPFPSVGRRRRLASEVSPGKVGQLWALIARFAATNSIMVDWSLANRLAWPPLDSSPFFQLVRLVEEGMPPMSADSPR